MIKKVTSNSTTNKNKISNTPSKKSDVADNSLPSKTNQSIVSSSNNSSLVNIKKSSEVESKAINASSKGPTISKKMQPLRKASDSQQTLQNQPKEEEKENPKNEQNKYSFLKVFNDKIIDHILSFVQLKDFSKFATLSKESRNRIPRVLKQINYSQEYKELKENFSQDYEGDRFCSQILDMKKRYLDLINNQYNQLKKDILSFEKGKFKTKDDFYDVLHIGVNFLNKTRLPKQEIIPFIQKNGIKNIFKNLENEILIPATQKVNLSTWPTCNNDTCFTELIQILYQHIALQQENKLSDKIQKNKIHLYKRLQYFEKYYQLEKKFNINYNRPIWCLKKTSNVFDYLNKNNITIITKFLSFQEISNLTQTSKSMNSLVVQGIQSLIQQEKIKRDEVLQSIQMSDKEAKTVMYILHYLTFQRCHQGLIHATTLQQKPYYEIFYALCQVFPSDIEAFQKRLQIKDSGAIFYLSHSITELKFDQVSVLDKLLQQYTDSYIDKEIQIPDFDYYKRDIILLQKYIKGLKLYIEINKKDKYQQLTEKYINNIYKYDNNIYKYELIARQSKEQLLYFTIKLRQPVDKVRRTKANPKRIFDC